MTLNGAILIQLLMIIVSYISNGTTEKDGKCYPPYGCFSNKYPWNELWRLKHSPDGPEKNTPHFLFYTREQMNISHPFIIDREDSIKNSSLKKDSNLYLIIHGFYGNGEKNWILRMKNELFEREDCNIVVVDWKGGAGKSWYPKAVANTRLIGAMTARLASQLVEVGKISPSKIHIIGHSLGAHVAGYIGYNLRNDYNHTLGRITGLDPAGPLFEDTHPLVRLDPTDADFVTAIHTDSKVFGIAQSVGHIDFYPNGGKHQPGCEKGPIKPIFVNGKVHCNHGRSEDIFIESINTVCPFLAVSCESWDRFQRGECFDCQNQTCIKFGFDAQLKNSSAYKSFYLMTRTSSPFCGITYRIRIIIRRTEESFRVTRGTFMINIIGANGKTTNNLLLSGTPKKYMPGRAHTVLLSGDNVGKIEAVKLTFMMKESIADPLIAGHQLQSQASIVVNSLTIDTLELGDRITVCPDGTGIMKSEKTFTAANCPDSILGLDYEEYLKDSSQSHLIPNCNLAPLLILLLSYFYMM